MWEVESKPRNLKDKVRSALKIIIIKRKHQRNEKQMHKLAKEKKKYYERN